MLLNMPTNLLVMFYSVLQTEKRGVPCPYIQNPASMIQMTYKCVYLVARKPEKATPNGHSVVNSEGQSEATPPDPWPL